MGQRERIEIENPCPLTPSLKRSLMAQGIKKSLNLRFRPNPMLVAVSLITILMISGLVWFWNVKFLAMQPGMNYIPLLWEGQWWLILILVPILISIWFIGLWRKSGNVIPLFSAICIILWDIYGPLLRYLCSRVFPGLTYHPVHTLIAVIFVGAGWITAGISAWSLQEDSSPFYIIAAVVFLAFGAVNFLVPLIAGVAWNVIFIVTGMGAGIYFLDAARTEERVKLKHLKTAFLVVLLIVIGVAMAPQVAESAGEASSIMNLEGPRIWILGEGVPDPPVYTISADEYAHVHHGWNSKGQYSPKIYWSELSELEMNEFNETSTFELTINGEPIELSCARWLDSELDVYYVIYYIQFKPGDLATGNHTFSGTWYSEVYGEPYSDDTGTCPITSNVTVNVV